MNNNASEQQKKSNANDAKIAEQIGAKARRKMHARRRKNSDVWFGLGMMGLIGWSIVVPTLLGAALGTWLDKNQPGQHSWTLALLMAGLTLGCFNAWYWVDKEDRVMREEQDHTQDDGARSDDPASK